MQKDLKSFFFLISSALLFVLLSGSFFAYTYFDFAKYLSPHEQTQLFMGGLSVFAIIFLILYLFAKKFLFPILDLSRVVSAQKEGNTPYEFTPFFDDEISFINEHLVGIKQALDKDVDALDQLSLVDNLTGIKNRRYFFEFGEGLFKLAKRNKEDLSVIMFDIDNLKTINVKYGNKTGDNILKVLTEVTERHIRKSDILSRFGGEEFAILLPRASHEDAGIVAKKIQNTLETPDFKHKADTYFSISVGISSLCEEDIFLRDITLRADAALLKAKDNGRNRIEFS